jgi:hypothetical protein
MSGAEAFAAGTTAGCVGVTDLKPSFMKGFHVIQLAARNVEDALGIDHDTDSRTFNQDIPLLGGILQIHFVLEPGTTPADDGHTENTLGRTLFLEEMGDLTAGGLGNTDDAFVTESITGGVCVGLASIGCKHTNEDH